MLACFYDRGAISKKTTKLFFINLKPRVAPLFVAPLFIIVTPVFSAGVFCIIELFVKYCWFCNKIFHILSLLKHLKQDEDL